MNQAVQDNLARLSVDLAREVGRLRDQLLVPERHERDRCLRAIAEVRDRYAEDIFPEDGNSQDCRSARLARSVCDQIRDLILDV